MPKESDLQESFFTRPELSRGEREYLIQKAQKSARTLVESARSSNGPVLWQEAGTFRGVQMYKGEARHARAPGLKDEMHGGMNYACGAVSVNATLEEVAEFFDVSTTPKMKQFAATQDDILDGVVLYTLVAPSPANQHLHQITVKWFLGNMPSRLIKLRDFLTLECQDVFTDKSGRRGWVRSYHSVKLPCCPDLQSELGFVRGAMYHSGYVFVESERPGWLDCIFSLQVNLKGNVWLPSALYWIAMKSRIKSIAGLSRCFSERRLGKQAFLSDLELVPKRQRKRCHLCQSRFGVFLRRARCRKCGEVVCHACSELWNISSAAAGAKQVRVCTKCAQVTDKQVLENFSLVSESMDDAGSVSGSDDARTPHSGVHANFPRDSMYTHQPFKPHVSQDGASLKPLEIPESLFDAPRHRPNIANANANANANTTANANANANLRGPHSNPGSSDYRDPRKHPPTRGPPSTPGSDYRDEYTHHRRGPSRGAPPPPPPTRYDADDRHRRGWGHDFDPRDRRYDPKFADFTGTDPRYDPRDRRGGYDDPRRGGYDDPRRGGYDDPRAYDGYRREPPREHRYVDPRRPDPRDRQFNRMMDERNGRMNTTFVTDATSPLTDFSNGSNQSDEYPLNPRTLDHHTRQHGRAGPVSNHRGRSNSRLYEPDPRPPPPRQPPPPPGPYRRPPSSEELRRKDRAEGFFREENAAQWADRSAMDAYDNNYANLEYDFTSNRPLTYPPPDDDDDDDDEVEYYVEEPRYRGAPPPPPLPPPRSNQPREEQMSTSAVGRDREAQALAAAAMKFHAGRQRQASMSAPSSLPPPPPPLAANDLDSDDFDENRTMTFNSPKPQFASELYSVTSSMVDSSYEDDVSTLHDYSVRQSELEPESEDRGSLSVDDDANEVARKLAPKEQEEKKPQAPTSTTPTPTSTSDADKSQTVAQIYEQILTVTKKQHELDPSPAADVAAKAALALELAELYKQLNELNLYGAKAAA